MSTQSTWEGLNPSEDIKPKNQKKHDQVRLIIRYFAAILSAVTAAIYLLIGFQLVSVLDNTADQYFGFFAAAAYILGVFLLLIFDSRLVWSLGAILQVLVIYAYFDLASQRVPAFELWGILIRIVQVLLLIALTYLAVRTPAAQIPESVGGNQ